jgi:hypothetical protein
VGFTTRPKIARLGI